MTRRRPRVWIVEEPFELRQYDYPGAQPRSAIVVAETRGQAASRSGLVPEREYLEVVRWTRRCPDLDAVMLAEGGGDDAPDA